MDSQDLEQSKLDRIAEEFSQAIRQGEQPSVDAFLAKYGDRSGKLRGLLASIEMIEGLKRGVHAFMPTGMHHIYVNIYQLYEEGNHDEAENLFLKLLPVLTFSNQHLDISIHFYKRLLYKQGIYPTPNVREPILQFDSLHQEIADKLIEKVTLGCPL